MPGGDFPERGASDRAQERVRVTYDRIAGAYDDAIGAELDGKPVDRGLLIAFAELCGPGVIADVGCGPGHVTRFLSGFAPSVLGIDLSEGMVRRARSHDPGGAYAQASMLALPFSERSWSGAAALYSIIHLPPDARPDAMGELARAIRPGGWLLVAFHIDSPDFRAGDVNRITEWFGRAVDIDGYFLDPDAVVRDIEAAGFTLMASTVRQPWPTVEHPSRRCYLLAQRSRLAGG